MTHPQEDYFGALGIDYWYLKKNPEKKDKEDKDNGPKSDFMKDLAQKVAACTACPLHKTRRQTVFGTGNEKAELVFVGEAPGAEEDKQGKPFVGRAGQLLTQMIQGIGFSRSEVYITNILKSRPPNNRDPSPAEVKACTPFLIQQINYIRPQLLVALGRIAAHFLLETQAPLGQLRGKLFHFKEIPLMVTYHPAYLLRAPREKAKALEDLTRVFHFLKDATACSKKKEKK